MTGELGFKQDFWDCFTVHTALIKNYLMSYRKKLQIPQTLFNLSLLITLDKFIKKAKKT